MNSTVTSSSPTPPFRKRWPSESWRSASAVGRVSRRTQNANPNVNWQRIASFRNNPAHEYYEFKPENLWEFVQDVLPNLETKLRKVRVAPGPEA